MSTIACPASNMFFPVHSVLLLASFSWAHIPSLQGFMQDENVACRDLGKVLFEYTVGCFGTSQLQRATRFPNVPTRACDSFSSVQYYNLGRLTVQLFLNIPLLLLAIFPHTTMTPVTLSWPNSKDGANFAKL